MLALLALLISGILFASLSQGSSITLRANAGCSFHLSTGGAAPFWVGQLDNGQARGGSNVKASTFTWFGDAFVDQQGRGCFWTPPSNVLQCDVGAKPAHGFDIPCNGVMTYNGQSTFYQCPTGDGDQVNLYLQSVGSQCQPVTLTSDGCTGCNQSPGGSAGPQPATAVSSSGISPSVTPFTTGPLSPGSSQRSSTGSGSSNLPTSSGLSSSIGLTLPSGSTSSGSTSSASLPSGSAGPRPTALPAPISDCPADLSSNYHNPSMLVPIDRANPDKAYGQSPYGQVSPNASTLFTFDVPASDAGKSCKVFFALPSQRSASYFLSGDGAVVFSRLGGDVNQGTTYNDVVSGRAGSRSDLGALRMNPGNTYVVEAFACPAGQKLTYAMDEPVGRDTCLVYSQGTTPVPIGMFVSTC